MKYCKKCNINYDDKFIFCRKCGSALENTQEYAEDKTTSRTSSNRHKKVFLFSLLAVAIIAIGYYLINIYNPGFEKGKLYAAVKVDDKWGFINQNGKYVMEPRFKKVGFKFCELLLNVQDTDSGKWGYIDKDGKFVIKPQFEEASAFSEGLAAAKKNGKYGFIDKDGKFVIKPQFDKAFSFEQGLGFVEVNDKCGIIDKQGRYLLRPILENIPFFYDGLSCVKVDDLYGYIDTQCRFIVKPRYDYALDFSEGLARVRLEDGSAAFLNQNGEVAFKVPNFEGANFVIVGSFREGLAPVQVNYMSKSLIDAFNSKENHRPSRVGAIDRKGNLVIGFNFVNIWPWSEGLAVAIDAKDSKYYGYIDKKGNFVIKPQFANAWDFHNGYAIVKNDNERFGFIDTQGKYVVKPEFDKVFDFKNGFARVVKDDKIGYANKDGKIVIMPMYSDAKNFEEF